MKNKIKYIFVILFCLIASSVFSQESKFKKELKKTFKFSTFYAAINGGNSISDVDIYSITNGLETDVVKTPFDYSISLGQIDLKKPFKFATFYGAVNGGTSVSNVDVYSVTNGLTTTIVETPFDYSISLGVRKIARFGYENRANTFYDGTEKSYSDGATLGKVKGFEFLFETDYKRQQGINLLDQHHFLRYVADKWVVKVEYLQDGFADVQYFEASQRYRYKVNKKLSFNIGAVQRISEPYGYDPLSEWVLSNGNIHYTNLAIEEGYSINFAPEGIEYLNPSGAVVATNSEVWEAVAIPGILSDYAEKEMN